MLTKPTYLNVRVSVMFLMKKKICCNVSITSLPVEVSNQTFNATNKALSAAGETGLHGYQLNTTVSVDDPLIHLELTAPLSISAVPGEAQKEPNNFKNGYYQGPESNGPEGHRRSPQECAESWVFRH